MFSDLKKFEITHVADLHNVLRSKVIRNLFTLRGKKVAATDKGRADKKALTRAENKVFWTNKIYVWKTCWDFLKKLDFQIDLSKPTFPEKAVLSNEILSKIGDISGMKLIGIAFAQYEK